MKIVEQSFELLTAPSYQSILKTVTTAASTCYHSHPKDMERFVATLIKSGHTSTVEHVSFTFKIVTDRAVSHELVRHRIASYSQESQRYCAYKEDVSFVRPHWVEDGQKGNLTWLSAIIGAEKAYKSMLDLGIKPEDARGILPNATATTIVVTMNIRSLLNFFTLRTAKGAHPDMRRLAKAMLKEMKERYPAFFEHLED
jgi:thymidylate synthase (FAD)